MCTSTHTTIVQDHTGKESLTLLLLYSWPTEPFKHHGWELGPEDEDEEQEDIQAEADALAEEEEEEEDQEDEEEEEEVSSVLHLHIFGCSF